MRRFIGNVSANVGNGISSEIDIAEPNVCNVYLVRIAEFGDACASGKSLFGAISNCCIFMNGIELRLGTGCWAWARTMIHLTKYVHCWFGNCWYLPTANILTFAALPTRRSCIVARCARAINFCPQKYINFLLSNHSSAVKMKMECNGNRRTCNNDRKLNGMRGTIKIEISWKK